MKQLFLILMISIFLIDCTNYNSQKNISTSRINFLNDSLRKVLKINDSIKVIYKGNDSFGLRAVIIDYNFNSIFHKELEEISKYTPYDSSYFYQLYTRQLEKGAKTLTSNLSIPALFKTRWIPAFSMNKYYYLACEGDYQLKFEITDSTFIRCDQTGAEPYIIDSVRVLKNQFEIYARDIGLITFTEVEKSRSIYLMKESKECSYLIPINQLNKFPIIYLHSYGPESILAVEGIDKIDCK